MAIKWMKNKYGCYDTTINGHKLRIVKNNNDWVLKMISSVDVKNGFYEYQTVMAGFKTLKSVKLEVELSNWNY